MIRWIVAGVGDIAQKRVIPAILAEPRSTLAGVVTSKPEKADAFGTRAFASVDAALPDCDALYIATPVALHRPMAVAALAAGKHVLCEKPTALNYVEAAGMAQAPRSTHFGVAYYRRLYPKVIAAKRLLAEGAIGQPLLIEMNCHYWFTAAQGHRAWLLDPVLAGGGPLFDIASHRIDLANFLFGDPVAATGLRSNAVHQWAVEDNATVVVNYAGGVRAVIDVRWNSRVERDQCRISGTDGALDLDPLNGPFLHTPSGTLELPPHANLHYPLVEDFVTAILERREPVCPIHQAIQTDWVTGEIR
ncbi:MAG: Gfo/Idh/MocA family oxidoreductase [Acidobacteria bacterium]|nr:Gfo/Idh/MocA family oxidoreductase [Acidobacteriota bacterium]